ncbi:MAG: lipoyl(octanoyl) transferase LipB [Saprospiraceae bacterium]
MKPLVHFEWVNGLTYKEVWDLQMDKHRYLIDQKLKNRHLTKAALDSIGQEHQIIFCEHSPVYTLGKSGSMDHLLLTDVEIQHKKIEFFKINRGGDITYHGPGQITGYPILDLDEFFTDVHKYVRFLEEAVIILLGRYHLKGIRLPGYTGVWLPPDHTSDQFRKICAIGVHLSRWVTMHGFAFNVNTDLTYFDMIVPCGIVDENKAVTSLQKETGSEHDLKVVGEQLLIILSDLFGFSIKKEDK